MIIHKHHIIPKHAGGTDDPSNLIELTIEEHAKAHKLLFEQFGRWQDKLAWKALSGQISVAEAIKIAQSNANRDYLKDKNYLREHGIRMKNRNLIPWNKNLRKENDESGRLQKASIRAKKQYEEGNYHRIGDKKRGKPLPEKDLAAAKINLEKARQPKECEHCHKIFNKGHYVRWHGDKCKMNKNAFDRLREVYPADTHDVIFTQLSDTQESQELKMCISYATDKTDIGKKK